jgi:RNA polymerase sigma factor (sigma-70 family)
MRFRGNAAHAREAAIERHLPLVHSVARRYARSGEPVDELIGAGTIGLGQAVDRFGAKRGMDFSTLAVRAIDDEIRRHLQDRGEYDRQVMAAASKSVSETKAAGGGACLIGIPRSLHAELMQAAQRENISLNALVARTLASAVGPQPRPADPNATRARWATVALAANFVIVALAAIVGIVLLIVAWTHGA